MNIDFNKVATGVITALLIALCAGMMAMHNSQIVMAEKVDRIEKVTSDIPSVDGLNARVGLLERRAENLERMLMEKE